MQTAENTLFTGKVAIYLDAVDSTNNHAKHLLSKGKPSEGTAIIAGFQHAGRGQTIGADGMMGNKWDSEADKNLLVSYIFYPRFIPVRNQFYLNMAVSLAVRDTVEQLSRKEVKVKWPNDIYVGEGKICGILIENTISNNAINASIVGIGLNVNQLEFDAKIPNAISLAMVAKKQFDLKAVFEKLSANLENWYLQIKAGKLDFVKSHYLHELYQFQANCWYHSKGERFVGKITNVDEHGRLIMEVDGEERKFEFKEVGFE